MLHKISGTLNVESMEYYFNLIRKKNMCTMAVRVFALALVQPRLVLRNNIDNPCVLQIALKKNEERARE